MNLLHADVLLTIGFQAAVLLAAVVIPGWALCRLVGFRSRSWSDVTLVVLVLGAAYTSQMVTLLLLAHVYLRATAVIAILAPLAALVLWRRRVAAGEMPDAVAVPPRNAIDRAVLAAAALFILVYLIDAATSPMTWWDGLASWGKWAPDWGRRTHSANYLVGGYPQLVPRIISVLYKLSGNYSDVLPLDFFAAHVFYTFFAAWFVVAAVRLCDLLELPAWPAILAGLGSLLFREHIGAGTVDVLLAAQVTTLLALYLGWSRGAWRTAIDPAWVLAASVFATMFTKLTGIIGPLLVLSLQPSVRRRFASAGWSTPRRALLLGFALLLPFIIEQGYTELRIARFRPDPSEVNLSVRQTPALLATDAELTYRGGGLTSRPHLVQLRFWNSYDVPATLRVAFSLFLFGCLALSLRAWFPRAVLPVLLLYALMWGVWSSYDQRNIFAALPVVAIVATYGALYAYRLRPSIVWQSGIALFAGLFLVLAGGGLLKELQARVKAVTGPGGAAARLQAIAGGPDARIDFFYPQHAPDYRYVRALAEHTRARHVLVTSPMFRFFRNGAHALSLWPYDQVAPGDVFVAHEWHRPPDVPGWTFVQQGRGHRIWVFDPSIGDTAMRAATPAAAGQSAAGPDPTGARVVEFDVPAKDLVGRGYVVWEAELPPGSKPPDVTYRASSVRLDPVTTIVRESAKDGTTRISGVIVGEPEGESLTQRVTIEVSLPEQPPVIRRFRTSGMAGRSR